MSIDRSASDRQRFIDRLHQAQVKVTLQRLLVCETLASSPRPYLTVEEIRLVLQERGIDFTNSTVLRTVQALVVAGLASEITLRHRTAAFLWATEPPPAWLLCQQCGSLTPVDPSWFARLREQLEHTSGFQLSPLAVTLSGLCQPCRTSPLPSDEEHLTPAAPLLSAEQPPGVQTTLTASSPEPASTSVPRR